MINDHLASEWPNEVRERLLSLEQGDVLFGLPPITYYGRRATATSVGAAGLSVDGVQLVSATPDPDGWIIVTQGCDIAEEDRTRPMHPFLEVAPVYIIEPAGSVTQLELGDVGVSYLHHLNGPEFTERFWVADLRFRQCIDKGLTVGLGSAKGFADAQAERRFAERIARLAVRPAYDRRIVEHVVESLRRYFRKREPKRTKMLEAGVEEVRLRVSPEPLTAELLVIVRRDGNVEPAREALDDWYFAANRDCRGAGIDLRPIRFTAMQMLDAQSFAQSDRLLYEWFVPRR